MENTPEKESVDQQQPYVPRPKWQVWMARAGLVVFLLFVVWQLIQIATAGML
ncbi:MAG: hypothetical protein IJN67_01890 [Oscillospiraceae bacterium]|nr:hypothetical protein [Oscillospiraceae bacterium]